MRYFLCLVVISMLLASAGCKPKFDPSILRCNEDLNTIPEMALFLKNHRGAPSGAGSGSLQGIEIALTFDWSFESETNPAEKEDDWCYPTTSDDKVNHCLEALKDNGLPPSVNFVVGSSLDPAVELRWLQDGNQAGNLTFNRPRPKTDWPGWIDDLSKNDGLLSGLWARYPPPQKYFRYPGYRAPEDQQARQAVGNFLQKAGYEIAPATIDGKDDRFAQIYCAAVARGDSKCAATIVDDYYQLLRDTILKARVDASKAAGHDIKQIMAVETNKFTCDNLKEILGRLKDEGVRFIRIEDALHDSFYAGSGVEATERALAVVTQVRNEQLGKIDGN